MERNSNKALTAITALIIGVLIGGATGYAVGNNKNNMDTSKQSNSSQSQSAMEASKDGVMVGGALMVRNSDIVDNAANAKNVTTLVAAVKAAGLVDTLKLPGPYTVFGPNNDAFNKLPAGTVDNLLKPENKSMLASILTYHVVAGTYTSADLKVMAQEGKQLTSVQGGLLTPVMEGNTLKIKDAKGNIVGIETADVISSNGVTHVVDSVLMSQ